MRAGQNNCVCSLLLQTHCLYFHVRCKCILMLDSVTLFSCKDFNNYFSHSTSLTIYNFESNYSTYPVYKYD